jgi:isoleucyl-tRNA synthetase
VDLSALYLDIVKDRLYCEGAASKPRRAAQTALYQILEVLVHLMAPILSFTAEEIWQYMPDKQRRPASVFLSHIPETDRSLMDYGLADDWDRLFKERGEILKALEVARNDGIIGHSLDAEVLSFGKVFQDDMLRKLSHQTMLKDILIVSSVKSDDGPAPEWLWELMEARGAAEAGSAQVHDDGRTGWGYYSRPLDSVITVFKARGDKCERCWKYDTEVGRDADHPTVCPRCAAVLKSGVSA